MRRVNSSPSTFGIIQSADKAETALHQIVEISQKVTTMIAQIAHASEQQSTAADEISKNVEGINKVTSETALGTHQIAQAADDLNRLTENLQSIVQRFKIEDNAPTHRTVVVDHDLPRAALHVRPNGKLIAHP